jgi:hypothetical protein
MQGIDGVVGGFVVRSRDYSGAIAILGLFR